MWAAAFRSRPQSSATGWDSGCGCRWHVAQQDHSKVAGFCTASAAWLNKGQSFAVPAGRAGSGVAQCRACCGLRWACGTWRCGCQSPLGGGGGGGGGGGEGTYHLRANRGRPELVLGVRVKCCCQRRVSAAASDVATVLRTAGSIAVDGAGCSPLLQSYNDALICRAAVQNANYAPHLRLTKPCGLMRP
jgi:hypothetical protein